MTSGKDEICLVAKSKAYKATIYLYRVVIVLCNFFLLGEYSERNKQHFTKLSLCMWKEL